MAKIERKTQKIFAGNAATDELAVFGSMITGTPVYNDDIEALQSEAYTEGWKAAVAANEAPFMEEMNAVQYGFSKQLAYLFQQGIPEWDAGTTYYLNSFCQVGGVIYKSKLDENINHSPGDDTEEIYWTPFKAGDGGSGGLEVCDIGMALYIDETKGLRRWLNGQIVAINQNTQGFLTRLKKIVALYPSLLTTEENWQAAKKLSAFGQVGKFVFNYAEDEETVESVRLPAVVNVQGLLDLQNLGMTVEAGLPNIEGMVYYGHGYLANATGAFYRGNAGTLPRVASGGAGTDYNLLFDASRSNPIYGATDTIQEEAIQYPYYIQIATGQETEVNITNEIELNNPFFFGMSQYFDVEPNNLSRLKSDGMYKPKSVYPDQLLVPVHDPDETGCPVRVGRSSGRAPGLPFHRSEALWKGPCREGFRYFLPFSVHFHPLRCRNLCLYSRQFLHFSVFFQNKSKLNLRIRDRVRDFSVHIYQHIIIRTAKGNAVRLRHRWELQRSAASSFNHRCFNHKTILQLSVHFQLLYRDVLIIQA